MSATSETEIIEVVVRMVLGILEPFPAGMTEPDLFDLLPLRADWVRKALDALEKHGDVIRGGDVVRLRREPTPIERARARSEQYRREEP